MKTKDGKIEIESIEVVSAVFQRIHDDSKHRYVIGAIESNCETKHCDYAGLDGYGKRWFACLIADCFDPPMAIVRADNEGEAIDIFVDAFEYARLTDEQVKDIEKDSEGDQDLFDEQCSMSGDGYWYDAERMSMFEVVPVQFNC